MRRVLIIGNGIAGNSAAQIIKERSRGNASVRILSTENVPLYSACALPEYISGEIDRDGLLLKDQVSYERLGIETDLREEVISLDTYRQEVHTKSGRCLGYDSLIIASGSSPKVPFVESFYIKGVFLGKTIEDAEAIRRYQGQKAVVIGAGPIGIEYGLGLRKRGYRVSILETMNWILPTFLGEKQASFVESLLLEKGIHIESGLKVTSVKSDGYAKVKGVETSKGFIDCDLLLLATGMKPNVALTADSGVEIGLHGGIVTNQRMETNKENVYACGDCVESMDVLSGRKSLSLLWHSARQQGLVAGFNEAGINRSYHGSFNVCSLSLKPGLVVSTGGANFTDKRALAISEKDSMTHVCIGADGTLKGFQYASKKENWEGIGPFLAFVRAGTSIGELLWVMKNRPELLPWKRNREFIYAMEAQL